MCEWMKRNVEEASAMAYHEMKFQWKEGTFGKVTVRGQKTFLKFLDACPDDFAVWLKKWI